jgi:cytochrome c biogenesis protein CcmG, thiol:disulfide interchange protein DsbE
MATRIALKFAIIAGVAFAAPASIYARSNTSLVGKPAPDFVIKMFDKSERKLADYANKVVVINYWATWCTPCKAEMPMMSSYHRKNRWRGFEIVGVITKDSVAPSKLTKLAAALSYPLATNLKGKYGILEGVPTNYVIDRKGIVRYAKVGSFEDAEFAALIEPLLKE